MKRINILIRLFVLAAMMLSFGETVWASTCASMSMIVSDAAASGGAMPNMPGMPAEGEQPSDDDDPTCPLGSAALAQGCLTAASLPASSAANIARGEVRMADIDVLATAHEDFSAKPLFHPPRV